MEPKLNLTLPETATPSRLGRALPYLLGLATGILIGAVLLVGARHAPVSRLESLQASRRNAIVTAVEQTRRAVVTISAKGHAPRPTAQDELLAFPFRPPQEPAPHWIGSGFVIHREPNRGGRRTPGCYIITNEHVVRDAELLIVSVGDRTGGSSANAELVGASPEYDLALLRVDADFDTTVTRLGDSDSLLVGEWAIAIGSPFGYELENPEPSVSVGVISGVQRDLREPAGNGSSNWPYMRMIQTDAAINDGNSGGPLVNSAGEVIGVNTARLVSLAGRGSGTGLGSGGAAGTPVGGNFGVNFSIPINTARWVWEELRDYREVRKPWIGWRVDELPPDVRVRLDLPEEEGIVKVTAVESGSPADRAGIRPGDIIQSINGLEVYSVARANRILFGTRVGADLDVVLFDGQLRHAMVHVIEDPSRQAEREARRRTLG